MCQESEPPHHYTNTTSLNHWCKAGWCCIFVVWFFLFHIKSWLPQSHSVLLPLFVPLYLQFWLLGFHLCLVSLQIKPTPLYSLPDCLWIPVSQPSYFTCLPIVYDYIWMKIAQPACHMHRKSFLTSTLLPGYAAHWLCAVEWTRIQPAHWDMRSRVDLRGCASIDHKRLWTQPILLADLWDSLEIMDAFTHMRSAIKVIFRKMSCIKIVHIFMLRANLFTLLQGEQDMIRWRQLILKRRKKKLQNKLSFSSKL